VGEVESDIEGAKRTQVFQDDRGSLGVVEFSGLPFSPRRFFWLFGVRDDEKRAGHGHKECHQFLIALEGSFRAVVSTRDGVVLDRRFSQGQSFHLEPQHWLDLSEFASSTVVGVFASHPYDEDDYIRRKEDLGS
jgi:UDP-2-acetamido-3-amino-2,3-dideoxy-glucuronate N-acetyltransferase